MGKENLSGSRKFPSFEELPSPRERKRGLKKLKAGRPISEKELAADLNNIWNIWRYENALLKRSMRAEDISPEERNRLEKKLSRTITAMADIYETAEKLGDEIRGEFIHLLEKKALDLGPLE